jgi:hypothetical protein
MKKNIFALIFTIEKFAVFKCSNEEIYNSSLIHHGSSSAATETNIGQV